ISATVALDDAHVTVDGNDESAGECPGTATNPTAAPGFVCVYPWFVENVEAASPDGVIWGADAAAAEKWGFQVTILAAAAGSTTLFANWAYTAPESQQKPGGSQRDPRLPAKPPSWAPPG